MGTITRTLAPIGESRDAEPFERGAAEQRERRAQERRELVVEAEELPALGGRGPVGELGGGGDERDVPAEPEPEEQDGGADHAVHPQEPEQDRPMTASPTESEVIRPIRSISPPTTITSAYIPRTCAPMIGKTSLWE